MRLSFALAVAALASTVSASFVARQGGLPGCATTCIATADFGGCEATDNACLCKNEGFVSSSTNCIVSTCEGDDLETSLNAAKQLCAAVGVTLTSTPAALTSATSTPAGSPSETSSGAASTTSDNAASMKGVNTLAGVAALLAAFAL
ncbi:hypothetical protein AGABI1DRAFT_114592 [Agaricus bisporus var. burnettii JB137-S8]|uniref:CFEM domain-containing protein n=1 Tax=Agaricus bisporus var. burnettii (strain JB137-S8 / ATCC MYA-4627 / FGSC 10392) TaxID=597362 RepID=K5X5P3_AGABU|nr:uncharacterized protein AGABI1DRAFT_114592 [Agaricus bisporus var. burnettii JB137-S8]EKM78262.1 hypothetical protein AGABI1DRAFT_114592 [Agaricus bisporus var. burnettii JB137-S8]